MDHTGNTDPDGSRFADDLGEQTQASIPQAPLPLPPLQPPMRVYKEKRRQGISVAWKALKGVQQAAILAVGLISVGFTLARSWDKAIASKADAVTVDKTTAAHVLVHKTLDETVKEIEQDAAVTRTKVEGIERSVGMMGQDIRALAAREGIPKPRPRGTP